MNYDHNKNVALFKFQLGYRKIYLNSPKGYSRKIINAQKFYTAQTISKLQYLDYFSRQWIVERVDQLPLLFTLSDLNV